MRDVYMIREWSKLNGVLLENAMGVATNLNQAKIMVAQRYKLKGDWKELTTNVWSNRIDVSNEEVTINKIPVNKWLSS